MSTTLCIPRIDSKITKERIFSIFRSLNWGYIENIRESNLIKENDHKRLVIKIRFNKESMNIMMRINQGETMKIVYDDPWYMRVCKFMPL